jgi:hypothetical protein
MPRVSTRNTRRRSVQPVVAAVVQPVAKRLSRIEALLIEMRYEQDVQLRRVAALQTQLDTLTEIVRPRANDRIACHRDERSRRTTPDSLNRTETPPANGGKPTNLQLN